MNLWSILWLSEELYVNEVWLWICSLKTDCGNWFYVFPVTKAMGCSGACPIVISFSLRSPSSNSVCCHFFWRIPLFQHLGSTESLFLLLSSSCSVWRLLYMFFVICAFLDGFVNHCSQPCPSHALLTKANPFVLWWEFKT